jgi:hypothetical protein
LILIIVATARADDDDTPSNFDMVKEGHAIILPIAWVILFPLGAVIMRLSPRMINIHIAIQLFALMLTTVGVGMGIWMAMNSDQVS